MSTSEVFIGVDLCEPQWRVAIARHDAQASGDPLALFRAPYSVASAGPRGELLWELTRNTLAVVTGDVTQKKMEEMLNGAFAPFRLILSEITKRHSETALVTFCIPYGTPRIARRWLPTLFDKPMVKIQGNFPFGIVEAPVALALEALAREKCRLGDRLLLLTGSPTTELTAALISEASEQGRPILRFETLRSAELCSETYDLVVGRFDDTLPGPRSSWTLLYAGQAPGLATTAQDLGERLRLAPDRIGALDADALALGAIRYAGHCRPSPKRMLNGVSWIDVDIVAADPIGVIGTNQEGAWFWRRLCAAAAPLPLSARVVTAETVKPDSIDYLVLAECGNPRFHARHWISAEDWKLAKIRWHEYIAKSLISAADTSDQPHVWTFKCENRSWRTPGALARWTVVSSLS